MINDDKRLYENVTENFMLTGTPWMGKADIGTNTKAPVKAVYILQRAEENTGSQGVAVTGYETVA